LHQHLVHFNRDDAVSAAKQVRCKRALSRADLNDDIGLLGAGNYSNLLENGFAGEEVLTETSTQATILPRLGLAFHFDAAVSKGNADSTCDGSSKCGSRPELGE
jgi:hypothetical protein